MTDRSRAALHQQKLQPLALHRQRGLSLVEMMIGTVLGLIIVSAVFNVYSGTSRSSSFNEGLQVMQENGRVGISLLQRSFRIAGYSPVSAADEQQLAAFDIANSSDTSITIQSQQAYDCNGAETTTTDGIAVNTYALNTDTLQLTCTGNAGNTRMPIIDGVEEFRVLYGVDEDGDPETSTPQRYVPYDSTLESSDIVALRFALLVNSGEPIRTRNVSETFVVLDKEIERTDRLAREVFSGTVMLRNR